MTQQRPPFPPPHSRKPRPLWLRPWFLVVVAVVIIGGMAQCGSGGQTSAQQARPEAVTTTPAAPAAPENRCKTVTAAVSTAVLDGVPNGTAADSGLKITKTAAVRATELKNAWAIAIRFTGPGLENWATGVWIVTSLDRPGPVQSANGIAHRFTQWPKSELTAADQSVTEAEKCVN